MQAREHMENIKVEYFWKGFVSGLAVIIFFYIVYLIGGRYI